MKLVVVPASQVLGETEEMAGVGSPTVNVTALLVPNAVVTVRLWGPVLADCEMVYSKFTCVSGAR